MNGPLLNQNMPQLPREVTSYKQTKTFTEETVPRGLLADHQTKAGTWGVINVLHGTLIYTITEPEYEGIHVLGPQRKGIVHPEHKHHIEPQGAVTFYVEFYQ